MPTASVTSGKGSIKSASSPYVLSSNELNHLGISHLYPYQGYIG